MRLGLLYASLGAAFGLLAWLGGSWPAAWLAANGLVLGGSYLSGSARLLGKRPDGTLSRVSVLALLPFYLVTWLIWALKRTGPSRPWVEVAPGLWVGRRPTAAELPDEADLVVDMTAEFPRPRPWKDGRAYWCLPTLDGHVPRDAEFSGLADRVAAWKGRAFVHCAAGHGRSVQLAAAVLVRRGLARDGAEAYGRIKAVRPGAQLNAAQRAQLEGDLERASRPPSV